MCARSGAQRVVLSELAAFATSLLTLWCFFMYNQRIVQPFATH
mgnify:CR=1 FL=1